jgi:ribulose-5-phosphate 4-epimerase/fuculose-1-phosphate aldolase
MHDQLRFDLCCGARALYRAGLSVGIAGHLSISVGDNRMLANRFGPSFGALTPDDVLLLDWDGHLIEGRGAVNDTIRLHGVIHKRNPSIVGVAHTHPPATVTLGTFRVLPEIWDQEGCLLANDVTIAEEEYSGLAASDDRVSPFADALRTHSAIILPNHGAITTGPSIKVAIFRMLTLEGMAQRHLAVASAAHATGLTPRAIAPGVAAETRRELETLITKHGAMDLVWTDLLGKLRVSDRDLFVPHEMASQGIA